MALHPTEVPSLQILLSPRSTSKSPGIFQSRIGNPNNAPQGCHFVRHPLWVLKILATPTDSTYLGLLSLAFTASHSNRSSNIHKIKPNRNNKITATSSSFKTYHQPEIIKSIVLKNQSLNCKTGINTSDLSYATFKVILARNHLVTPSTAVGS